MVREGKSDRGWRQLVEAQTERLLQRGDVARHDEPGREYFHRPGEVLVPLDRVDQLGGLLREHRAEQSDSHEDVGIAVFRLPQSSVHDVVLAMQKSVGDPAAAAAHHVLFGTPRLRGCPGRPAFPGAPVTLAGDAGSGVVIAVIDTGQASDSLQLDWVSTHVVVGQDDIDLLDEAGDGELDLEAGHGTFVAAVVGQTAPGAKVLARKAVDTWGVTDDIAVAKAVRRAVEDGAQIINLSLGGYTMDDAPPLALSRLLGGKDRLGGVVVVAAAGNDAVERRFYPAALDDVIGVAALNTSRRRAGFSNFGPWVDASAEGERLLSMFVRGVVMTDSDGDGNKDRFDEPYAHWSGTSFAAPQVAAAIAVRMSTTGESAPDAAYAVVRDPALRRSPGIGVKVLTSVRSHRARAGLP